MLYFLILFYVRRLSAVSKDILPPSATLEMEVAGFSDTVVTLKTTKC